MSGLSSSDLQSLNFSINELIKADRDLIAANDRAKGVLPGGSQGPLTSGQAAAASNTAPTLVAGQPQGGFWNAGGGKTDTAISMGLSATRQMLAAGGSSVGASLAGGLAGGPLGLASAALTAGVSLAQQRAQITQNALGVFANAPVGESNETAARRASFSQQRGAIEFNTSLEHATSPFIGVSGEEQLRRDASSAKTLRQINQAEEDELGPTERARQIVRDRFEKIAQFARTPEARRKLHEAEQRYFDLIEPLQENLQSNEKFLRTLHRSTNPTTPGNQGGRGSH